MLPPIPLGMTRLEFERRKRRFSQVTLESLSGVRQETISLVERGRMNPTEDELQSLARALGISPAAILLREVRPAVEPEELSVPAGTEAVAARG